ncbi:hypothetical protein ELI17_14650 [Rhizobium ruizarguesonis]|nr:hypothetical protein ELI17_14650 [Rhizobium ruizarguesonis]
MTPEQKALLSALRDDLRAFKAEIRSSHKNKPRHVADTVREFDGGGKIFEAFIVLRLKLYFEQSGATTAICDARGGETEVYVLRGGPGHLRRNARTASHPEPGFVSIRQPDGRVFELHNSVEWPDHFVGGNETHELDVSIASPPECDRLDSWYQRGGRAPRPTMGIEAKFHGRAPGKEISRGVTGLAARLGVPLVYLITSMEPSETIVRQLRSLCGRSFETTTIVDAAALSVRLTDSQINAQGLVHVVRQINSFGSQGEGTSAADLSPAA